MSENKKKFPNTEHTLTQPLSVLGVWISPHYMLVQTHEEITTSSTTGLNRLLTVGGKKNEQIELKQFLKKNQYMMQLSKIINFHP